MLKRLDWECFAKIFCTILVFFAIVALAQATANAQFSNVYNIPPDPSFGDDAVIGSDTQVNIFDSGMIGENFASGSSMGTSSNIEINLYGGEIGVLGNAYAGTTLNMSGGILGALFHANSGSIVNISGGSIGGSFEALGGQVNVTGGQFNYSFAADSGSVVDISGGIFHGIRTRGGSNLYLHSAQITGDANFNGGNVVMDGGRIAQLRTGSAASVEFKGGEFLLDGVAVSGAVNIGSGQTLTGTLSDGSVLIVSDLYRDAVADGSLTFTQTSLPDEAGKTFNVPGEAAPNGLRNGQTLNLGETGDIGRSFSSVGGTINMTGGTIGWKLKAYNSNINISGGSVSVGGSFSMLDGSTLTNAGGELGIGYLYSGAIVNQLSGHAGPLTTYGSSELNLDGGSIDKISANSGSQVNISGGILGRGNFTSLISFSNSEVIISGGNIGRGAVFWGGSNAIMTGGTLGQQVRVADAASLELRGGDFLLDGVSVSGNVNLSLGSILTGTMEDGTVVSFSQSSQFEDRIGDGTLLLTNTFVAPDGPSVINVPLDAAPLSIRNSQTLNLSDGGRVEQSFVSLDSTFNMSGGELGYGAEFIDSVFRQSGGGVESRLTAYRNTQFDVSGGTIAGLIAIHEDAEFNLFGTNFFLDGVEITNQLLVGTPFEITSRNVELSGTLSDGNEFSFTLLPYQSFEGDFFSENAHVNLILAVPEPGTSLMLSGLGIALLFQRRRRTVR